MEEKDKKTEIVGEVDTVDSTDVVSNEKMDETFSKQNKPKRKKQKKEVDLSEYEGLSDDELYAKIQTEKLLKKKKTKKILTLSGLCFAFALAVCLIILAAVPVSLKPRCMEDGFARVKLYPGTMNTGEAFVEGEEKYNEFMKYYDKAFGQSYISAIFSGSLFSYNIEEKCESVSNVLGSNGELITNNTYFVQLNYAEEQVFTYQNGRPYKSNYYTSKWNGQNLTFTDVYFVVNQTAGFQKTEVYVVAKYPKFDKDGNLLVNDPQEYLITITVKANTFAIYDNWSELTK